MKTYGGIMGIMVATGVLAAGVNAGFAEDSARMDEHPVIVETFDQNLSNRASEGPNSVEVRDGKLVIKTREKTPDGKPESGQYLWFKADLPSGFRLEFDFTPISPSGFFLLCFCAKGVDGADILGDKLMRDYKTEKDFKKYTIGPVNCYHISYRRNEHCVRRKYQQPCSCKHARNMGKYGVAHQILDKGI